jgi:hypothetical protein
MTQRFKDVLLLLAIFYGVSIVFIGGVIGIAMLATVIPGWIILSVILFLGSVWLAWTVTGDSR